MKRFFSFSPNGNGMEFHSTAEEAEAEAESELDEERDSAGDDGWSEEVDQICWGEIRQYAKESEVPAPEGSTFEGEPIDHFVTYNLADVKWHSRAADDVLAERQRQVEAEGWTPEHDDRHVPGQLALAAAAYAIEAEANLTDPEDAHPMGAPPSCWPWGGQWWKPSDARRDLVKAGALILAEIERIDRQA